MNYTFEYIKRLVIKNGLTKIFNRFRICPNVYYISVYWSIFPNYEILTDCY